MPPSHDPHEPFGLMPGDPFAGGADQVTAPQIEELTRAIQDLSSRLGGGASSYAPGAAPWWFKFRQDRPDAPTSPPPGSAAERESGWWGKYTGPDPEGFTYVRSHWRSPPRPRPAPPPAAGTPASSPIADAAATISSTGYPEWVAKVAQQTGENPDDVAAAFGIRGARRTAAGGGAGGGGRKPPWWSAYTNASPDPPGGGDPGRGPRGEPWWAKYFRSAGNAVPPNPRAAPGSTPWNRKRGRHPWHWPTTRRFAGFARLIGGKRAGRMAMAGMSAAAQRFAFSGSFTSAARVGVMGGAAAGGPVAVGIVGLGMAAVKAAEALQKMTAEQLLYNRELSKSSATMAVVFAERDVQERFRQREIGDRVAASARALTQAEQFKEDNTKEIAIAWERTKNELGAGWEAFKAALFMELNKIAWVANKLWEFFNGEKEMDKYLTMGEWMKKNLEEERQRARREIGHGFDKPRRG
jgi:hypothetical protein